MTNCIEIKGLVKEYKTFTLGPIDLKVPGGSILGLIGENGAGKTTLIQSMLGIVKPTAGTAVLLGADPDRAKEDIGMVLDDCFFSEYLRVRDVETVLCRVFKTWDKGLYRDYLDKFGLSGAKNIKELSRGMRMKLSLAAALAHRPRLLLLDEATAALDNQTAFAVTDAILHLDGLTRLVVTHRLDAALMEQYDEIIVLRGGKIQERGDYGTLMEKKGYFYSLYTLTE